jgi:predicted metal-dependent enzyme (double-stranded beta helix superfamily)
MTTESYSLEAFVNDVKRITAETNDEHALLSQIKPLARSAALDRSWLKEEHYIADEQQGFGTNVLHEEPDHGLFIVAVSWLSGKGAPPHNHRTWAVVVGVDGPERNIFWERVDDGTREGYAELRKIGEKIFSDGDVLTLPDGSIHSVQNDTDQTTLSFHVYGRHLNHTGRSRFDPDNSTEMPFVIKTQ